MNILLCEYEKGNKEKVKSSDSSGTMTSLIYKMAALRQGFKKMVFHQKSKFLPQLFGGGGVKMIYIIYANDNGWNCVLLNFVDKFIKCLVLIWFSS